MALVPSFLSGVILFLPPSNLVQGLVKIDAIDVNRSFTGRIQGRLYVYFVVCLNLAFLEPLLGLVDRISRRARLF